MTFEHFVTTSTLDSTWSTWNGTATTTSSQVIWNQWNEWTIGSGTSSWVPQWASETAAQRQARERQAAEARRQRQEREQRAEQLLLEHLDQQQTEDYLRRKTFEVIASNQERFRVEEGRVLGLDRMRGARPTSYCIHPTDAYPAGDVMLARKLMLETDVEAFLRTANAS